MSDEDIPTLTEEQTAFVLEAYKWAVEDPYFFVGVLIRMGVVQPIGGGIPEGVQVH